MKTWPDDIYEVWFYCVYYIFAIVVNKYCNFSLMDKIHQKKTMIKYMFMYIWPKTL